MSQIGPSAACLLGHQKTHTMSLIGAGPGQELYSGGQVQMADHRPVLPGGQLRYVRCRVGALEWGALHCKNNNNNLKYSGLKCILLILLLAYYLFGEITVHSIHPEDAVCRNIIINYLEHNSFYAK